MAIPRFGLPLAALVVLSAPVAIAHAQTGDFEADAKLAKDAIDFGTMTVGQARGMAKVLYLGRDANGETVMTGMGVGEPSAGSVAANPEAVAVVLVRGGAKLPTDGERNFAETFGRSVFIVVESSKPVVWEIARRGGSMQYRQVSPSRPTEWQSWR
jgi:hypothetical protein